MRFETPLDYFSTGCRLLHVQFPPCVARLVASDWSPQGKPAVHEPWSRSTSSGASNAVESISTKGSKKHWLQAPEPLHDAFDPEEVQAWDSSRFEMVGKVQDAVRNRGSVHQMVDIELGRPVAVKRMPNDWVCQSHQDFVQHHPEETELPWQDIACNNFLNEIGYPYRCPLLGVFRDDETTSMVTELASEGDLFSWCSGAFLEQPGIARELRVLPLARQITDCVRQLHELSIVHQDLSLENILLSRGLQALQVQVIDFGMTTTCRTFQKSARGKPSYQAPEVHEDKPCDGFLSDAFAVGVTLYCLLVGDYPWLSTRVGGCKCFDFVLRNGFRAYLKKRKLRGGGGTVAQNMSEPLMRLLEGLLEINPEKRLTLGETVFDDGIGGARRSVLDEPWLWEGPGSAVPSSKPKA
mmetsp:Transcript_84913/g.259264  ORF Transcript_84913/g.259264 Transcript_84913/m.259264 type:complete len:410 (-) Transcript_84913:133-1362(-)